MNPVTNYCEAILGENADAKEAIRLIPELSTCSDSLLDLIYSYSKPVTLKPGEVLIQEGLFDQWVYFIVEGNLDVAINGDTLGATTGPIIGERCILGEPRGATLSAGADGVMALGIEMSLVDEVNRDINSFSQQTDDTREIEQYSDEKLALVTELMVFILDEVIRRIFELKRTSIAILRELTDTMAGDTTLESDSTTEEKIKEKERLDTLQQTEFYTLLEKIHSLMIQDTTYSDTLRRITLSEWREIFILRENNEISLSEASRRLNKDHGIRYAEMVDLIILSFELTSKYTAKLNSSINEILSLFESEGDKQSALNHSRGAKENKSVLDTKVSQLKNRLFDPAMAALTQQQTDSAKSVINKLSQEDIDSFFS